MSKQNIYYRGVKFGMDWDIPDFSTEAPRRTFIMLDPYDPNSADFINSDAFPSLKKKKPTRRKKKKVKK